MKHFLEEAKKNFFSALGIVLIICAVIALIGLYTPERRLERTLGNADKAYTKADYEKACEFYEKAISLKSDRASTYLSYLLSKEAENAEDVKDVFNEGMTAFEALSEDEQFKATDVIVEYTLNESVVFADDLDGSLDALERGYELTDGNEDIKRILTERLNEKVESLRNQGDYDTAVALVERFDKKADLDAASLEAELLSEKDFAASKEALLIKVYNALSGMLSDENADFSSYDYTEISELDGSAEAEAVADSFLSDSYLYIVEGEKESLTGTGAALYTFGETYDNNGTTSIPYYFYVGNFTDGVRDGFGIAFTRTGETSYTLYAGQWKDDVPEGTGTRVERLAATEEEGAKTKSYTGTWKAGLAEGDISVSVKEDDYEDIVFTGTLTASEGTCAAVPTETDDYVILNVRDGNLIGVLSSDTEGYALMITLWQMDGEKLEAMGISS